MATIAAQRLEICMREIWFAPSFVAALACETDSSLMPTSFIFSSSGSPLWPASVAVGGCMLFQIARRILIQVRPAAARPPFN